MLKPRRGRRGAAAGECRIVGVQAEGAPSMERSWREGRLVGTVEELREQRERWAALGVGELIVGSGAVPFQVTTLDDVEREILVRALEHHRYNRTAAGISLGLSLRQMRYRMARLNVNVGGDLAGTDRE